MWIVTNQGFMSIVAKDRNGKASGPDLKAELSVRFRRPADAARLFPKHEVVLTPHGDYACRVFATRGEVAELMFHMVCGLSYNNFKSSIPKDDHALYSAANAAWSDFGKLQDGGPYGTGKYSGGSDYSYQRTLGFAEYDTGGKLVPSKKKEAQPGKRKDPFCDFCGKRRGAENLNEHGLCQSCEDLPEALASLG